MNKASIFYKEVVVPAIGCLSFFIWQLLAHDMTVKEAAVASLRWLVIFWVVLNVLYAWEWWRKKGKQ